MFQEKRRTLTQYYQRGVVDWKPAAGDAERVLRRRLAWDFIGGGLGGSEDQGVEAWLTNPDRGDKWGPWGHKVSNFSVNGTTIGFKDFFDRLGDEDAFGYPETDARPDTQSAVVLHAPGRPKDDRIRQYFQAAVLEYHPESSQPQKIGLIGDTLRDLTFPDNTWEPLVAFQPADPLQARDVLPA